MQPLSFPSIKAEQLTLPNPQSPLQHLFTNILLYCSEYYPHSKELLNDFISNVCEKHHVHLCSALSLLMGDLTRELVYGPPASYQPPAQKADNKAKDQALVSKFQQSGSKKELIKEFSTLLSQLKLEALQPLCPQLLWYSRSLYFRNWHKASSPLGAPLRQQLQLGGESWMQPTPFPGLLLTLKSSYRLILLLSPSLSLSPPSLSQIHLMYARTCFLQNKVLQNPVHELKVEILQAYGHILEGWKQRVQGQVKTMSREEYVEGLLEYVYILVFYYKYRQAEKVIKYCCQLLGMEIEYTGKLGRRTKYQTFDVAQIVMQLKRLKDTGQKGKKQEEEGEEQKEKKEEKEQQKEQKQQKEKQSIQNKMLEDTPEDDASSINLPDPHHLVLQQTGKLHKPQPQLQQVPYDQQSILLQSTLLTQHQPPTSSQPQPQSQSYLSSSSNLTGMTVLAALYYQWKTTPHDQLFYQQVQATISQLLSMQEKQKQNYAYTLNFQLLVMRSINQFPRVKHAERAIGQLEKLIGYYEAVKDKGVETHGEGARSTLYCTPYEPYLHFIRVVADKYISVGLSISAVQLMKRVSMREECIDILIQRQYKQKALQLIQELQQQQHSSPRLLCMQGDITNNPKLYCQAWQLSNQRYARAQRSLGWLHFSSQQFLLASQAFSKATKASYYHPNTWFTLGCAYLQLKDYEKAVRAFGECVCIDDTQGEAWGNLASCYMHLKKMKEAYSTLLQAVKHSESNWKLWVNLLTVALSLKQFYKYFECIQRLVLLNKGEVITEEQLAKITMIMQYRIESITTANNNNESDTTTTTTFNRIRPVYALKTRIDRLFQLLTQKLGQSPMIWHCKQQYSQSLISYLQTLFQHYRHQHSNNSVEPNDLVQGYSTLGESQSTTNLRYRQVISDILQSKQNQLNMQMSIGWNQNKLQCAKVKQVLMDYVEVYKRYGGKKVEGAEFRLFVDGLRESIEKCLEEKVVLMF